MQAHLQFGERLITASPLAVLGKNMQALTVKSIEAKSHPQTKMLFWFLFGASRGAPTRVKIVTLLKNQPYNTHQLSKEISMEYKGVKHHLNVLEQNNLITKFSATYGGTFFLSPLFEENQSVFDEIITKINSTKKFEGY